MRQKRGNILLSELMVRRMFPNADRAVSDADKLRGYVLSSAHPIGRFKAAFFRKPGYSGENWETFERIFES